jgi:hypothetical protein
MKFAPEVWVVAGVLAVGGLCAGSFGLGRHVGHDRAESEAVFRETQRSELLHEAVHQCKGDAIVGRAYTYPAEKP